MPVLDLGLQKLHWALSSLDGAQTPAFFHFHIKDASNIFGTSFGACVDIANDCGIIALWSRRVQSKNRYFTLQNRLRSLLGGIGYVNCTTGAKERYSLFVMCLSIALAHSSCAERDGSLWPPKRPNLAIFAMRTGSSRIFTGSTTLSSRQGPTLAALCVAVRASMRPVRRVW